MSKYRLQISWIPILCLVITLLLIVSFVGNMAVNAFVESAPIQDRKCIIIDPGHGGVDGGATSCTGVLESELNLQIALRLDDLLHLIGIKTIMTRKIDQSIHTEGKSIAAKKVSDLKQRVKIVNGSENSTLVSIHQNYFADSRYSGAQVFYAPTVGSDKLANQLQKTLQNTLNPNNTRHSKSADGIYLMQHISCTGILLECGFLSNPEEERNLNNPEYQKKLCSVLASLLSCYLQNPNS